MTRTLQHDSATGAFDHGENLERAAPTCTASSVAPISRERPHSPRTQSGAWRTARGRVVCEAASGSSLGGAASASYRDVALWQFHHLAQALGLKEAPAQRRALLQLLGSWAESKVPEFPPYPSMIGDDHSPYEYSVAFGRDTIELRLLVEAQGTVPGLQSNHEAAKELNERLARSFPEDVDFDRLLRVQDLFEPAPGAAFSMWHGLCLNEGRPPQFKVYLNPEARGADQGEAVVEEALRRLGFRQPTIDALWRMAHSRSAGDRVNYFSLDLRNSADARVKVYFAHPDATAGELDEMFRYVPSHRPGDVTEHCIHLLDSAGPFSGKPVCSCFSLQQGAERPSAVTFHLPVAAYAENDRVLAERVQGLLAGRERLQRAYSAAVDVIATRPLESSAGLHSYVSYRRDRGGRRLTVYWAPELFARALRMR